MKKHYLVYTENAAGRVIKNNMTIECYDCRKDLLTHAHWLEKTTKGVVKVFELKLVKI